MRENKYLFNGKELQDEHSLDLYDYHSRYYDPVLGRFTTIDPHAENYPDWNPCNYVADKQSNQPNRSGWKALV